MPTFPTLAGNPSVEDYEEGIVADPTVKSPTEGGYKVTRARFTRIPEKWKIVYPFATWADKALVKTFERDTVSVGGSSFDWTNPDDGVTYDVRFQGPVAYTPFASASGGSVQLTSDKPVQRWRMEFILEQV